MSSNRFQETDLYLPIKIWLENNGYTVRAEVKNCDISAIKGDELILIELKKSFTLTLLIQAVERQKNDASVYVAIPAPTSLRDKRWKKMERLLKRLELGLILVFLEHNNPRIEIVFHPIPFAPRRNLKLTRSILSETANRSFDLNVGGSSKRKLVTVYRENSIAIACALDILVESTAAILISNFTTSPKTSSILSDNYYGWFIKVSRGHYQLSELGKIMLTSEYQEIVDFYKNSFEKIQI